MKSAIITGANGFIGTHLVKELLDQNIQVYAVIKPGTDTQNIAINSKLFTLVECELANIHKLPEMIIDKQIDAFYHFAWAGVSGPLQADYKTQIENLMATMEIVNILPQWNIKKFIGAGSLHEQEGLLEMQTETEVKNLGMMYKSAKLAAHHMARVKVTSMNIDFFWPIITNTYGPTERSARLINSVIRGLLKNQPVPLTSGTQLYDFVYISDVARAFRLIGEKGIGSKKYIIGSGSPKPLRSYLETIGDILQKKELLDFGAIQFSGQSLSAQDLDAGQLIKDTGFQPLISFEQGIKNTIEDLKVLE